MLRLEQKATAKEFQLPTSDVQRIQRHVKLKLGGDNEKIGWITLLSDTTLSCRPEGLTERQNSDTVHRPKSKCPGFRVGCDLRHPNICMQKQ